ncbi:hypothetical protein [Secundilactobacillus kimchicus]|uniref:hypothetical protein n=1 Tax=Secundilactobacillus kimchicus TaxID=528209 RepID=UPI0006D18F90|nr:hypothetical protein [Secundilactobacillus kimchicus]
MDSLDESLIREYMHLDRKRFRILRQLDVIKAMFWQQSFMRSPLDVDEAGNPNRIVRFDHQIDAIIDMESLVFQTSQELAFKHTHWQRYLSSLSDQERAYIVRKYGSNEQLLTDEDVDQRALNQCNQIEEATAHKFGWRMI